MLMIVEWLPGPSLYTCLYISVCLKFSIVKNVCVFFKIVVPKVARGSASGLGSTSDCGLDGHQI